MRNVDCVSLIMHGDAVYVKNFTGSLAWVTDVIEKCHGTLAYLVKLLNNKDLRCHVDHVKIRLSNN